MYSARCFPNCFSTVFLTFFFTPPCTVQTICCTVFLFHSVQCTLFSKLFFYSTLYSARCFLNSFSISPCTVHAVFSTVFLPTLYLTSNFQLPVRSARYIIELFGYILGRGGCIGFGTIGGGYIGEYDMGINTGVELGEGVLQEFKI